MFGLVIAALMAVFSVYMFLKTGDWVAAVFCLGSVGYIILFTSARIGKKSVE